MSLKHLILTRFNVAMPGRKSDIRLKKEWLDERFKLFEEICLPSVASQSIKNFEWIIFFDTHTPDNYKSKIEALRATFPFKALYIDEFDIQKIKPILSADLDQYQSLLTSRLDSDDILAIDYIEKVQSIASELKEKSVINFDHGAILLLKDSKQFLYEYSDDSNPFASLLEPIQENITTILAVNHTTLHDFAKVIHIKGKPMWLQVVHGGNVSNRVKGKRVHLNKYNADFLYMNENKSNVNESALNLFVDNTVLATYRSIKEIIRSILKKIYNTVFK